MGTHSRISHRALLACRASVRATSCTWSLSSPMGSTHFEQKVATSKSLRPCIQEDGDCQASRQQSGLTTLCQQSSSPTLCANWHCCREGRPPANTELHSRAHPLRPTHHDEGRKKVCAALDLTRRHHAQQPHSIGAAGGQGAKGAGRQAGSMSEKTRVGEVHAAAIGAQNAGKLPHLRAYSTLEEQQNMNWRRT